MTDGQASAAHLAFPRQGPIPPIDPLLILERARAKSTGCAWWFPVWTSVHLFTIWKHGKMH